MSLKLLHKGTESERRWKIIEVSKAQDSRYLPQLYARLESDETYDNKRHIIRALGSINTKESGTVLMRLLGSSQGLILGDICRALGRLGFIESVPEIKKYANHSEVWVKQEANGAIKKLIKIV